MAVPETRVFIAFDLTASGGEYFTLDDPVRGLLNSSFILGGDVLVDVTNYVASVSINRGKSRELDQYTAGNASVTLHNEDRIFDPFYSASPFAGQILPRKQVVIETNGVRQFTGYIDDWDLTYDIGGKSFASISCVDGFMQLSVTELSSFTNVSQLSGERIVSVINRPEVAWPAGERDIDAGKALLQADTVDENTNALSYLQLVDQSEPGALFISKSGLLTFRDRTTTPPRVDNLIFSDELTDSLPARTNLIKNPNFTLTRNQYQNVGSISTFFRVNTDGVFGNTSLEINKSAAANSGVSTLATDGNRIEVTAGKTYRFSVYVKPIFSDTGITSFKLRIRNFKADNTETTMQESSSFAFVNDSVWRRISFSFTPVAGDDPTTTIAAQIVETSAFNAVFRIDGLLLEQSDSLRDFFDGDSIGGSWNGVPQDSTSNFIALTVAPYSDIEVMYGSENLYNRVIVTRNGGTPQVAESLESQAIYGVQTLSLDNLLLVSDSDSRTIADYLVGLYDQPELRFSKLTVNLHDKDVADQAGLLALELQDVVKIVFTPNGIGDAIEEYNLVTGIAHSVGIDTHKITYEFGSVQGFPIILDDPIYGILSGSLPPYDDENTNYNDADVRYDGTEQFGYILAF